MRARPVTTLLGGLLVGLLALGGCSAGDTSTSGTAPTSPSAADPSTPTDPVAALRSRCASGIPDGTPVRPVRLGGGSGPSLAAADFGPTRGSGTVLVLLHQTGPWGLCGWGRFAARAADAGIASVAVDMCGYAESTCDPDLPAVDQVRVAVAHARDDLGADRVVLVGASMGGSRTVLAVADGARVDAWVDVSGVSSWDGIRLLDRARALARADRPGLVVYARSDGDQQYDAAERLARAAGARFVDGGSGHGYELMTDYRARLLPAGRAVLRFVEARED
ncbi:hypothetical protein H5V45_15440 [Nocardioides sp. KIGAM211]|uniref:AB hydrolase-1 domain-containing protein n=1 Tax=Nocardioides luti TaxID=2761101 RepID=A0A7X0RI20_9ACTN|nr:hypothetical protein [Nocardioides luti]MBB6628719.1 hypothetical protein [Nocardioides luti]